MCGDTLLADTLLADTLVEAALVRAVARLPSRRPIAISRGWMSALIEEVFEDWLDGPYPQGSAHEPLAP